MIKVNTLIIVSHVCPVPPSQGNRIAICRLISWLRRKGLKVVFVLQAVSISCEQRRELGSLVDELYVVGELDGFDKALERRIRDCWPETKRMVGELVLIENPFAVVAEYIYMTPCFEGLSGEILKITHTHDMLSRVEEEISIYGIDTQRRQCSKEEERTALMRGDVIIAVHDIEADMFRALVPGKEVIVMRGLGYLPEEISAGPREGEVPGTVLMVGGDNPMNRRGLSVFCSEVWPKVLEALPHARFLVAGGVCRSLPKGTAKAESLGIAKDLEEEYRKAAVVVNPVEFGTGLKIKTIEALRYGRALVSTPCGVEGFPNKSRVPCMVADDWDAFARCVIDLLADGKLRRSMEMKAAAYANEHFVEEMVYAELHQCLEKNIKVRESCYVQ